MQAKKLTPGSTIGLFCPSHIAEMERYYPTIESIKRRGFNVKTGKNMQKDTYGYAASAKERADDLNALVSDTTVDMVLFSGGASAVEILPYIDYENIKHNPKLFSSYSDATSILNAIHAKTGLVTYYGFGVNNFADMRYYDYMQFQSHFIEGHGTTQFESDSKWKTLQGGNCEGILIGGFALLFGLMLSNEYFTYDKDKKYILFLEDHEKYHKVGTVATYLGFIGQTTFMKNVTGLVFGHYSDNVPDELYHCLERFGARHNIPVVYTDDFGHGTRHAIFPIGVSARLDADKQSLAFME